MGLSRLDNFLKSVRGTIIYVDPNSLDSTDSIENTGNSLTRPFKTIQRALIEAARFSYQRGDSNDRFNKTTILLYPGDHIVDNRPGYIPTGSGQFSRRSGEVNVADLTQWDLTTNFDLASPDNTLYKLNSVHGGVIVPRGTSIVGLDLRKTKIRPKYVPNPKNNNIERSCVFRTTGACYFWQFTILDANPSGTCYKDYTSNQFVPNFSHHKLAGFEYADGVNGVYINDDFLNGASKIDTTRTDLDMYYEKVGIVYGESSGRDVPNDYPSTSLDIQPVIDEYRIVGPKGDSVGITSIRAGDGVTSTTTITVDLVENIDGLSADSPIQISGIGAKGYDGQYIIYSVNTPTQITYKTQNAPIDPLPTITGSTLSLVVDTVTSASPYIFNISLRSVYGMCGLLADGDKATGFKSMVVAQYTGIGLQKDDDAFVKYNTTSGQYQYSNEVDNLHTDSRSRFRPEYENFHIKATNDAFLQLVSVFAIGYAQHFVTENGGDIALNNSNSNFGAKSLVSYGFKREAFSQDDHGYITHIIPPKDIDSREISVEFKSIAVGVTTSISAGAGTTSRLYLYQETNENIPPKVVIDGYNIGAKQNEQLIVQIYSGGGIATYASRVVMPYGSYNSTESSSEKIFTVGRSISGINSISTSTYKLTLSSSHSFINGESVRVISDNGSLPDGLNPNQIYYISTVGITTGNEIFLSKTLNDAINGEKIQINNKGGTLSIVSRVSDKNAGDIGHPVQWDGSQWYVGVSTINNGIYDVINSLGVSGLGNATTRTYVTRTPDSRNLVDTIYRVRYVLPKNSSARPPVDGFVLQESNDIIGTGTNEISQLYNTSGAIVESTYLRNPRFIANISSSSGVGIVTTEIPHNLKVGDEVEIVNVLPTAYNGTYTVTSTPNAKEFRYSLGSNPGTFANDTSNRTSNLPYFRKKKYNKTYQVYRTEEIQPYVQNVQDGIYYLTLINHSNKPVVSPFQEESFGQPVENLYPQFNNDNPKSDPNSSRCHASSNLVGQVVINNPQNSITKETLESFVVGYGITNIITQNFSGGLTHKIFTSTEHGLSGITSVSISSPGSGYGSGSPTVLYNARLVNYTEGESGSKATAKITVDGSGSITDVKIIDGGSAYSVGNVLRVVGVATTSGFVEGVVTVDAVSDNIGDTLKISGITSTSNYGYNTYYRVTSIDVGKTKEINVVSSEPITSPSTSGIGSIVTQNAGYIPTGKSLTVSSFVYNSSIGIATVTFSSAHGLKPDDKVRISGANQTVFNNDFTVEGLIGLSSCTLNIGIGVTSSTSATGTIYAYRSLLTSCAGDLIKDTENTSARLNYQYGGITATLGSSYSITSTSALNISNAVTLGFDLGDYLLIDNEIFRVKQAVTTNSVEVFRALLGSPRQAHQNGSVVRRIKVNPVELRRNSIIRASGHTFEYLGFGPGNYSTAFPDKQNRALSNAEKFLAQSTKLDGGIVVYTGMNSDGDFFAGNKKINSATGKEETFDTPVPTNTGEKDTNSLVNITDTQKLFVESSIKVEGGKDKNVVSEFDGPVVFKNKVSSSSDIEANSIFVKGDEEVSREISISNSTPTTSGNYGDVKFNATPSSNENAGWIYTTENEWKPFGGITSQLYGVGVSTSGSSVGFSTLINFTGTNVDIGVTYNPITDVSTVNFNVNALGPVGPSTTADYATIAGIASYSTRSGISTYANTAGIATFAGSSTNLLGGTASQIVYQSAPNTTAFLGNGIAGQVLHSNGSLAPYWSYVTSGVSTSAERISINSINGNFGDTTVYPVMVANNALGIQTTFIDSELVYNASTNALTATTFVGNLTGNATSATTATTAGTATNILGGSGSQLLYQSAANTTAFIPNGTLNQILRSNGTSVPSWTSNLNVGFVTATRFFGDGSGLTGIVATGSGIILRSNTTLVGTISTINFGSEFIVSPISQASSTINIGTVQNAVNATNATNANNIRTQTNSVSGTYFLTFVDSDNSVLSYESLYTDGGISYNPATNVLSVGTYNGGLQHSITFGNGLSSNSPNFRNTGSVTLELGSPSSISATSTNTVTTTSHTHELANGSITVSKLSGNQSGTAPVYGVRAWCTMSNGGGTPTVLNGGNISSITRSGNDYTVFFAIPMSSTSYAVVISIGSNADNVCRVNDATKSTTSFSFSVYDPGTGNNVTDTINNANIIVVG